MDSLDNQKSEASIKTNNYLMDYFVKVSRLHLGPCGKELGFSYGDM